MQIDVFMIIISNDRSLRHLNVSNLVGILLSFRLNIIYISKIFIYTNLIKITNQNNNNNIVLINYLFIKNFKLNYKPKM